MHCFLKAYYDVTYFYFHLRKSNQMDTTVHCVEHQLTQKIIFIILFAYNILLSDGIDMCHVLFTCILAGTYNVASQGWVGATFFKSGITGILLLKYTILQFAYRKIFF